MKIHEWMDRIAAVGALTFRRHKNPIPLVCIFCGNVLVFYAYYGQFSPTYIYLALALLVTGPVVNYFMNRNCDCGEQHHEKD